MKNVYIALVVLIMVFSFGQYANAGEECQIDIDNEHSLEILNEYYNEYVTHNNRKFIEWTYLDENVIDHTILIEIK